mgnify:CR=1 FL=1
MLLHKLLKKELASHDPDFVEQFMPIVRKLYAEYDYHEYGGAPLIGANGYCLISHGSSKARTICNTILRARQLVEATPVSISLALLMGFIAGERGQLLFECNYVKLLDCSATNATWRSLTRLVWRRPATPLPPTPPRPLA